VFTRDIFSEPGLDSWQSVIEQEGFHGVVAAPLRAADDAPIGTITGDSSPERVFHCHRPTTR
jgi:hypothetical protein